MYKQMETLKKYHFSINLGTAVMVIGFIAYWVFIGAGKVNEIDDCREQVTTHHYEIQALEDKNIGYEIALAEIKVKLDSIDARLIEIKNDLKIANGFK